MSRTVSAALRRATYAQQTGEVPVLLVTFDHEDLDTPRRVSSDPTQRVEVSDRIVYGTVSRGLTFYYAPFELALPSDQEDAAPRTRVRIDATDQALVDALRALVSPVQVTMEVVLASSPDLVEAETAAFDLVDVSYSAVELEGELVLDALTREPFPAMRFDPARAPGVFRG